MDSTLGASFMTTVGVVIAALIAGAFSYFTLVTAKEQKVSEFRQQWIDSLRASISEYVSALSYLSVLYHHNSNRGKNQKDKFDMAASVQETYSRVNKYYSDIVFRINPTENDPEGKWVNESFLAALETTRRHYLEVKYMEAVNACDSLREATKPLLKYEWKRVKRGEPRYVRAQAFAIVVLLLGLASSAFFLYLVYPTRSEPANKPPTVQVALLAPEKAPETLTSNGR